MFKPNAPKAMRSLLSQAMVVGMMLGLNACQAPALLVRQAPELQRLQRFSAGGTDLVLQTQVLSAKYALEAAEKYALKWSPEATLTHVFGQYITQQGLPDRRRGSWTFSFINYDAPDKGFQVHMQAGKADVALAMPASRLPRQEPLEIRAWNFDSHQLIPMVKKLFPTMSTPLPDMSLIEVDRRLVWRIGDNQLIDAMNGRVFTP